MTANLTLTLLAWLKHRNVPIWRTWNLVESRNSLHS